MSALYDTDVLAWANQQAALLRAGKLNEIDVENIAEEIEDVGKSEIRYFESRLASLITLLLKWKFQPDQRCKGWEHAIQFGRNSVRSHLKETPSLKSCLIDPASLEIAWCDAIIKAIAETDLACFPQESIWTIDMILSDNFLPD